MPPEPQHTLQNACLQKHSLQKSGSDHAPMTIAILAIVTIPILSYFTDAAKHNARSRQKQNASVLAQDVLEEFKNTP